MAQPASSPGVRAHRPSLLDAPTRAWSAGEGTQQGPNPDPQQGRWSLRVVLSHRVCSNTALGTGDGTRHVGSEESGNQEVNPELQATYLNTSTRCTVPWETNVLHSPKTIVLGPSAPCRRQSLEVRLLPETTPGLPLRESRQRVANGTLVAHALPGPRAFRSQQGKRAACPRGCLVTDVDANSKPKSENHTRQRGTRNAQAFSR